MSYWTAFGRLMGFMLLFVPGIVVAVLLSNWLGFVVLGAWMVMVILVLAAVG